MVPSAFDLLFATNVPHILENIFFSLDYVSFQTCYKVSEVWDKFLSSKSCQKLLEKMLIKKKKNEKKLKAALFIRESKKKFRDSSKIQELISSAGWIDFNYVKLWNHGTPLMEAIFWRLNDVVQVLLDEGANPDLVGLCWRGGMYAKYGWRGHDMTPLSLAACTGNKEIVQLLLERKADPNTANTSGTTPLHKIVGCNCWIAESGRTEVVKLLINGGAQPNKEDNLGWTPLHHAASMGRREMVEILLEMGADPNITSMHGRTPLFLAEYNGHIQIAQLLRKHTNPDLIFHL